MTEPSLRSPDGCHVVHFKDCRHADEVPDGSVDMIFTSPPYGLNLAYGGGDGQVERHIQSYDDMRDYLKGLEPIWDEWYRKLAPGGYALINIADINGRSEDFGENVTLPTAHKVLAYWTDVLGATMKTEIFWKAFRFAHNASNTSGSHILGGYPWPLKGITMRDMEFIWVLKKPGQWSAEREVRRRASAFKDADEWFKTYAQTWDIQGARKETTGGLEHPAPFPLELVERAIRGYSVHGDMVADPFGGTGTVLAAARKLGRRSVSYEINPAFRGHILAKTNLLTEQF